MSTQSITAPDEQDEFDADMAYLHGLAGAILDSRPTPALVREWLNQTTTPA